MAGQILREIEPVAEQECSEMLRRLQSLREEQQQQQQAWASQKVMTHQLLMALLLPLNQQLPVTSPAWLLR